MSHAAIAIPGLDRIGGAERQAMLLAKGLRRRGWRVSVVALSGYGGPAAAELRDAASRLRAWRCARGLRTRGDGFASIAGSGASSRTSCTRTAACRLALPMVALAAPVPVVIDTLHSSSTGKSGRRMAMRAAAGSLTM